MPHPTVKEFIAVLRNQPLDQIVREVVFQGAPYGGTPYVFRNRPESFSTLRNHLRSTLNVSEENVTVVGSAKLGFSISPHTFPRRFAWNSDVDILVVDESLFDQVWTTILRWNYPRRYRLSGPDWDWTKGRMHDLYWGRIVPDRIRYEGLSLPDVLKPLRDLSTSWFNAFRGLSQYPELAARDVSGRLYRTWDHALLYQIDGLRQIRDGILT